MRSGKSQIELRLPEAERKTLDEMLLNPPVGMGCVTRIYQRLGLKERYGIPLSALHRYAARLRYERKLREDGIEPSDFEPKWDRLHLPESVREQVDGALIRRPDGLESVKKIYGHFRLRQEGIPLAGFKKYARLKCWRTRMGAAGRIVRRLAGNISAGELDEKISRAQMNLVSAVMETIHRKRKKLQTEELVKLSRVVSEQLGAALKTGDADQKGRKHRVDPHIPASGLAPTTHLPPNFDEVIREIYGVELGGVGPAREKLDGT